MTEINSNTGIDRNLAATVAGLPLMLAPRLRGSTQAEIQADADAFAQEIREHQDKGRRRNGSGVTDPNEARRPGRW